MLVNIGKGIEMDVDTSKLNEAVMSHVVMIGLRNILMDSHAGVTPEKAGDTFVDQSRATAEKKLAAMYDGEVRVAGTREGDPVRAEAIRLATKAVQTALRGANRKDEAKDAKFVREKAVANIDKFIAQARTNVEAQRELNKTADIEI